MRTTLTLEDDIAAKIQSEARKTGKPFKQIVNETLREGFLARRNNKDLPPFKVKTRRLGLRPGLSYDCIGKLLEELEGPLHR